MGGWHDVEGREVGRPEEERGSGVLGTAWPRGGERKGVLSPQCPARSLGPFCSCRAASVVKG